MYTCAISRLPVLQNIIIYSAMANVYLRAESYLSQTMRRARMYNNNNNNFVAVHCVRHFIQHSQYVLTDGNVFFQCQFFGARLIFKTAFTRSDFTTMLSLYSSRPLFIFIFIFIFFSVVRTRSYLFQGDARELLTPPIELQ